MKLGSPGRFSLSRGFARKALPCLLAACGGLALCSMGAFGTVPYGAHVPELKAMHWEDLEGRGYSSESIRKHKATLFFFGSTECPISNIYIPRVKALADRYRDQGVQTFFVDSNGEDQVSGLRAYAKQRALSFPVIKDRGTAIADWLSASVTPEAILMDAKGEVVYRGRIDDNQDRSKVIHDDLKDALDEFLAGNSIIRPRTIAIGCAIFRDSGEFTSKKATSSTPTFCRDVAAILDKNCLVCHRKGESAPFSLETYQEARTWAAAIKSYTGHRLMPPWKAVPGYGSFQDERALTDKEIALIAKWADSGAPKGDPNVLPPTPKFPDSKVWSLGKPDLVVQPSKEFHLSAEGLDVYRNYVLPVDFKEDEYLSAMEFKPGNRAVVHHIVLYVDPTGKSAEKEGKDGQPGYTVPGTGIGVDEAEWGEVWVPGRTPRFLADGVAIKIPKGSKLVMQVHYHKNGAPQTDCTQVALFKSKGPVQQVVRMLPLVNEDFVLTPGSRDQLVTMHFNVPLDVHLRTIFPHMHLLGREMRVTATLPDSSKKELIFVKDWDFNWQETYVYREPVFLPKGTKVDVVTVYDNSESNPRQTNHPPKPVRWGEQTTDEMCVLVMGLTVDREKLNLNPGTR